MKNVLHILIVSMLYLTGTGLIVDSMFKPEGTERYSEATLGLASAIMANQLKGRK